VAIAGRSRTTLDAAVHTLGDGVLAVQADVTQLADMDRLFAEVAQQLGNIDVLFVNAGVVRFLPLADTRERVFDEQVAINFKGAFFTLQKALPYLHDGASIIVTTVVGDRKGMAGTSLESAVKAALRSLVRTAAAELVRTAASA
jgi:NAD(P)-dependent dehydrogenase (short-subunit alcohol dehydrogenase family)